MPIFGPKDREVVGAGALSFAFLSLLIALVSLVVTVQRKSDAGASGPSSVTVALTEWAITPGQMEPVRW